MGEFYAAKERLELVNRNYPQAVRDLGYEEEIDKMLAACGQRVAEGQQEAQHLESHGILRERFASTVKSHLTGRGRFHPEHK